MSTPCPAITKDTIEWLEATYPLPMWDGTPEAAPEYHRRVGVYELTQALKAQLTDEHGAEDAQAVQY